MPAAWDKFTNGGPAAVEPLIRIDGEVPEQARKQALAADLVKAGAMRFYLHDPTRQLFPQAAVHDGTTDIVFSNSSTTSLGEGVQTELVGRVKGEHLLRDIRAMSGSNWEQEPLLSPDDQNPLLVNYRYELEPALINLRPGLPRDVPTPEPGGRRSRAPGNP